MLSRMQTQRQTQQRNCGIISMFASFLTLVSLFSYGYAVDYHLPHIFVVSSVICGGVSAFISAMALVIGSTLER